MDLEWDEEKRQKTISERGLDFADLARIDFDNALTFADHRKDYGESRYISFGHLDGRLCAFCWTARADRIRIVSMRKANDRERKKYMASAFIEGD